MSAGNCAAAILENIPADAVERYRRNLDRARKQLRRALRERVL
jgi:tetrahydromethanopterin S-methyltransferase subunit A